MAFYLSNIGRRHLGNCKKKEKFIAIIVIEGHRKHKNITEINLQANIFNKNNTLYRKKYILVDVTLHITGRIY